MKEKGFNLNGNYCQGLAKVTSDKLEAFEMWLYRRMLRISWKEHKTNADVLHKMKTKRSLLNTIKKGNVNILDI